MCDVVNVQQVCGWASIVKGSRAGISIWKTIVRLFRKNNLQRGDSYLVLEGSFLCYHCKASFWRIFTLRTHCPDYRYTQASTGPWYASHSQILQFHLWPGLDVEQILLIWAYQHFNVNRDAARKAYCRHVAWLLNRLHKSSTLNPFPFS